MVADSCHGHHSSPVVVTDLQHDGHDDHMIVTATWWPSRMCDVPVLWCLLICELITVMVLWWSRICHLVTIWVLLLITANQKLKQMVADQQEAEKRKTMSQEIHKELQIQQVKISEKTAEVMEDLSKVEPAVREAQQGIHIITLTVIPLPTVCSPPSSALSLTFQPSLYTIHLPPPPPRFDPPISFPQSLPAIAVGKVNKPGATAVSRMMAPLLSTPSSAQ